MDLKKIAESVYGLTLAEAEELARRLGHPAYRGRQLLEWLYRHQLTEFDQAKTLPADLRKKISETHTARALELLEANRSSNGESTKFLYRTHDGRLLETVLISQQGRETVCVSTQLGCKMGCVFCASGKGKFGRNLSSGEIVEQVAGVTRTTGRRVSNIVYMGMGEPLDNFEATMKSLDILQAPWGFGIGSRRITVSTSGITPKMVEFVRRHEGRVRLSVSLHSSSDKTRTELMPINKRYNLPELIKTLTEINRTLKREITFEFTLIDGINDSREEAETLAKISKPLAAKINLIPYNPIREMDFKTPSKAKVESFQKILEAHGLRVTVRQTAGRDINAACGQLRLDREKDLPAA
ncbi:MAG: 23S rRNA (adenine(2503)-C(2))-methyltransferase RlmN [Candidatus Omnitrophica bacterium]|nr:23S rRNA (adenine(2503)-C(2))-methyltransferase RlmN [Candidatus Omnitrophota bacterium]